MPVSAPKLRRSAETRCFEPFPETSISGYIRHTDQDVRNRHLQAIEMLHQHYLHSRGFFTHNIRHETMSFYEDCPHVLEVV
jgi:hypothetical protein